VKVGLLPAHTVRGETRLVQLSQQRVVGNSRRDGYEDEESSIRGNERGEPQTFTIQTSMSSDNNC